MSKLVGLAIVLVGSVHHPLKHIVWLSVVRSFLSLLCTTLLDNGDDDLLGRAEV